MIGALWIAAYAYLLWVLFLAAMALKHAWPALSMLVRVLAAPAVLFALALDVGFNLAATIPFVDLPHEATFSQRVSRYKRGSDWRAPVARWICANLLDPFEIGGHCRT